jgi:hypothetical protein
LGQSHVNLAVDTLFDPLVIALVPFVQREGIC